MMQEKQLRAWRTEFAHLHEHIADCFGRREPRERARGYLQGLLAPLERKNGWQLAEAAGDRNPDGMQDFLARMHWDADAVRDALRNYVVAHLGAPDAVLVLDETGFIKKGEHSAGVQRQYSGTAGRIENCQVGVFLAYASEQGYALIDRELYLPESWAHDMQRRRAAHIPDTVRLRTKPQIGREMLERALAAAIPFAWVTADSVYGGTWRLRQDIAEAGRGYVLAVLSSQQWGWPRQSVADIADALPQASWVALSCGAGAKGPRWYEWAYLPAKPETGFVRGLLVRRHRRRHGERAYYFTHAPEGTPLENWSKLPAAAGRSNLLLSKPKAKWGWINTRCAATMPGTDMSRWRCWHTLSWLWCVHTAREKNIGPALWRVLLPLTVPEVRRLLVAFILECTPKPATILAWSRWRRRHQQCAKRCHWKARTKKRGKARL